MLHLGVPVVDQHEITRECLAVASEKAAGVAHLHIIDNASEVPYKLSEFDGLFEGRVTIHRLSENLGFYRPIHVLYDLATPADLLCLMHNDLWLLEPGWDMQMTLSFVRSPKLGMLGVFGSDEVDELGGRGGGSMCRFSSANPHFQPQAAGLRIDGLHQALVLDSMLMAMRVPVVPALRVTEQDQPCHFLDKVWPLRVREAGWDVGVLGIEVGHWGGITSTGTRAENDYKLWCERWGFAPINGSYGTAVYQEAERRFLSEWKGKRRIPSKLVRGRWV